MAVIEDTYVDPFADVDYVDPFADVDSAPLKIQTNREVRQSLDESEVTLMDSSSEPEANLSKTAVNNYFNMKGIETQDPLQLGRKLYKDNNLEYGGLQTLLSGESNDFEKRWDDEFGEEQRRKESTYEEHGPRMGEFVFAAESLGLGIAKAYANFGAGIGELALPKGLEEKFGVSGIRDDTRWIDENQIAYQESLIESGDYDRFIRSSLYKMGGDMSGQLMLMSQTLKAVGPLFGKGKLSLVAREKKWTELARSTALRGSVIGAMNFAQTEGDLSTKKNSMLLTQAYLSSPVLSSLAKSNGGAIAADMLINSLISGVYDPEKGFQLGGQYKEAIAEAKEITKDDPENYNKVLIAKLIPIVGPDAAFATLTRSIRSGERTRTRNATMESSRIFSDISGKSFDTLKSNMEKKYGSEWIGKMDDIDRLTYENARQTDALIQNGELPPLLQEIQKTIQFRVNPAEMARLSDEENPVRGEIASSEKTWRDADGRLMSGEDKVSIDDKGRVVVDGAKAEDVVVKDFEDVPDRPVDMTKALVDLEKVMGEYKPAEAQQPVGDPKVVSDKQTPPVDSQGALKVSPDEAKDIQKQLKPEKQMVSINSMEIIKDRIRSINEGVKLGKKLTKAQHKEQKVMRQDVINEAEKIVNDMTNDTAIRNRFKLRAQKAVKTNKSLATFIEQFTAFAEKDVDAKARKGLTNKLNKDISGSVHAEYAEAIIDLQDMINTDTSAKSKWRLQSQEDALSRHPDIKLPNSVIKKLSQTSIDEISTKDLGLIVAEVERLTQLGKTKYGIENKRFKDDVDSIVSDISRTSKQAPISKFETDHKDRRRFKSIKLWLGRGSLRPWNTMDLLDGGKATYDGTAHRVFVDEANVAFNRYMDINDQRMFGGESIIRANDMKVSDLSKGIKFNGHKFTVDQILSIYASSKNKLMHNAVLHGNMKGDKETYNEIVNHVANDSKLKSLADYIVYDYANNYDRVRKAVIRNENKILGQEENYIPMIRTDVDKPIELSEIANDLFGRSDMARELPDNSFTIDRAKVPESVQSPVKLGLFDQWEKSVSTQERYINLFGQVKKMEAVLADKDLSKQIKDSYGSDMKEIIDGYVTAYGNPMSIYGSGSVGHASRKLRKNIALGYLSFNMMTMLKQIPSIALYMGQGGGKNMLVSLDDFNKSWSMEGGKPVNDLVKFVEGKDPQVKHAHIERELAALKKTDLNGYERVMSSIGETGMKGIIGFDKAVRTIGWYSTYLKALESGKSDGEAVRLARNATLRTQPAASAKDLAHIYKEASPWFTMFSNQINQIYNLMSYQLPKSAMAGDAGAAAGIMSGLVINAVVFHTLMHGKLPETEEDFARMIKEQSLGKLPLVGGAISGAMSGYDAENPAVGLVTDATTALNKALESGDKKAQEKAIKAILQSAGAASGFPVTGARRALDFAEEGNLKDLFGIREN